MIWKAALQMTDYRVDITVTANNDVKDIVDYITNELKNPSSAKKLIMELREAFVTLKAMPNRHELVQDARLAHKGVRKLLIENYIAFYCVNEKQKNVTILRVLYKRRDWENLI